MDSSWFDVVDDMSVGFHSTRRSVLESRSRWTSTAAASTAPTSAAASTAAAGSQSVASHLHRSVSTAASSASRRRAAFLSETRDLDQELQATSARLREVASRASSNQGGFMHDTGFAARRLGLSRRFDDLMRSTGEGGRYQIGGEDDDLTKRFQAVKEENQKLQAVISDVTEVNKRWQKYNNDRQMYVQRLLSTIQDQQEEMNKTVENHLLSSKENSTEEESAILSDKCRMQEELKQQRSRLDALEKEYREHVAVLEFQVKAHRDDWEAERSEKQQLLKDKMAADAKVKQLQKDVRCLKLKLREERLENVNQCSCVGCHSCECDHRAEKLTPSAKPGPCNRDHTAQSKMYRTSVHLPCNSGHLLPRGTTLCFGDDLAIDSEEAANNLDKQELTEGILRSRSNSDEDSEMPTCIIEKTAESNSESDLSAFSKQTSHCLESRSGKLDSRGKSNENVFEDETNKLEKPTVSNNATVFKEKVYQSASTPNLITTTIPRLSCSVLHITPSSSTASTASALDSTATDSAADLASGVTIGFTSNGLASVFSFPQTPIVKSFSLPTSKRGENIGKSFECDVPVSQASSLGSSWSGLSIASPPSQTYATSSESLFQEKKSKLSVLGAFAKSMKQSKASVKNIDESSNVEHGQASSQKTFTWKAKYFEDGIATQTLEDLICPGCGQIFPPILHVTFLDHFEKCQNTKKEHQYSRKKSS